MIFDIAPAEEPEIGVELTITHNGFDSRDKRDAHGHARWLVMIASVLKTLLEGGRLVTAPV